MIWWQYAAIAQWVHFKIGGTFVIVSWSLHCAWVEGNLCAQTVDLPDGFSVMQPLLEGNTF